MLLALLLTAAPPAWSALAPGLEYCPLPFAGDVAHVVRIDPAKAEFDFGLVTELGGEVRSAATWARERGYVVTINAGMFKPGAPPPNVGHLVHEGHVNQPATNAYQSVLVFGPTAPGLPTAQLLDLDAPGAAALVAKYRSQVQNLRLIRGPGVSVWKPNGRKWSEAAVAQDTQGRLLFIFTRAPLQMAKWNEALLGSGLGVVRAMHVEGGPEASLSIHSATLTLDLNGSYETGFNENDGLVAQQPIPNVLGVRARATEPDGGSGAKAPAGR